VSGGGRGLWVQGSGLGKSEYVGKKVKRQTKKTIVTAVEKIKEMEEVFIFRGGARIPRKEMF